MEEKKPNELTADAYLRYSNMAKMIEWILAEVTVFAILYCFFIGVT